MKHPHPDRMAEVYRQRSNGDYEFLGYVGDPFPGAVWNLALQAWCIGKGIEVPDLVLPDGTAR
jgi:hypothetical protein